MLELVNVIRTVPRWFVPAASSSSLRVLSINGKAGPPQVPRARGWYFAKTALIACYSAGGRGTAVEQSGEPVTVPGTPAHAQNQFVRLCEL